MLALLIAAFLTNLLLSQFKPGFANQPVAHTMEIWNFMGMVVAGLAFALAGGCPARQLFMAGEGDGDAAVFVLGIIARRQYPTTSAWPAPPREWALTVSPRSLSALPCCYLSASA